MLCMKKWFDYIIENNTRAGATSGAKVHAESFKPSDQV